MLKNENIICISSIDWDFIWQGHQEIMSEFAKNGNRVLFIENTGVRAPMIKDIPRIKNRIRNWLKGVKGIRKEMNNLYVFSPLLLPFPYSRIAKWINHHWIFSALEKWMRATGFSNPVVWTFLPTPLSIAIIDSLIKKITVYYCIDNLSVSSAPAKKIKKYEVELLKKSDLVFVTSDALYNSCARYNSKVYKFPFMVNFQKFEKARLAQDSAMGELKNIRKPIVGYVGGIHKWIDQALVRHVASSLKQYSFVFIGPIQTDISLLSNLENIYFLGKKDHDRLPFFIKNFDACIIPYSVTDYTANVYPTKLNEYLAMGKPVISTKLAEVLIFNKKHDGIVYVAEDRPMFVDFIVKAVSGAGQDSQQNYIEVAKVNSWGNAIEIMSDLIDREIQHKQNDSEAQWKQRLISFYQKARRNAIVFTSALLIMYFVLFRSPFLWFLAEPLKISQIPIKSDVIVVFGGGVGETGSPGKSTIERARYAAELYSKGFADKIVFSTGYTYRYNDAENMKLIALSMGVKDEDIILEEEAHSAYENVLFSNEILSSKGWSSILLISSPYNMRRLSLVFRKNCPDVKVIYTPVNKCQFYNRYKYILLEQIRAIMHEYLGIIYYWQQGKI